jgi:hypothetical protein
MARMDEAEKIGGRARKATRKRYVSQHVRAWVVHVTCEVVREDEQRDTCVLHLEERVRACWARERKKCRKQYTLQKDLIVHKRNKKKEKRDFESPRRDRLVLLFPLLQLVQTRFQIHY